MVEGLVRQPRGVSASLFETFFGSGWLAVLQFANPVAG